MQRAGEFTALFCQEEENTVLMHIVHIALYFNLEFQDRVVLSRLNSNHLFQSSLFIGYHMKILQWGI